MSSLGKNIARLECGTEEGNAVFLNRDCAMTVKHCIKPYLKDPNTKILLYCLIGEEYLSREAKLIACTEEEDGFALLKVELEANFEDVFVTPCSMRPFEQCVTVGFNKNHNDEPSWRKLQSRLGVDMPRGHAIRDLLFMDDSKEKSFLGLSGSPILPDEESRYIIGLTVQQKTEKGDAYELRGISVASQLEFLIANGIEIKKVKGTKYQSEPEYYDYVMGLYKKRNEGNRLLGEESLSELYMQLYYYESEHIYGNVEKKLEEFCSIGESGVIWMVGEPGHGKTSMCIKAVADYVNLKRYNDVTGVFWFRLNPQFIPEMVGDHKLTLREAFSWGSIDGDRSEKIKPDNIKGSLVLLDGFDELKASLEKHGVLINQFYVQVNQLAKTYNLHIVVVSRTLALEQEESCRKDNLKKGVGFITCRYREGGSYNNAVWMLAPLSKEQQLDWVDRVIKYREKKQDDTSELKLYKHKFPSLQKNSDISGLLEIPILLRMVVQNYFEPRSGNRVVLYRDLFDKTLMRQGIERDREVLHKIYREIAFRIFVYDDDSAEINKAEFSELTSSDAYLYQYYLHTPDEEVRVGKPELHRVTFLHRSFYQYFLSEFLYEKLVEVKDERSGENILRYLWPRRLDEYIFDNLQLLSNKGIDYQSIYKSIDKTDCLLPDYVNLAGAKVHIGNYDKANNTFFNAVSIVNYLLQKEVFQEKLELTNRIIELLAKYNCSNISLRNVLIKSIYPSNDNPEGMIVTRLFYATLSYADLSYADLSYALLIHSNLFKANLSMVNLRNANLSYDDLCHANLSCADLSYADLSDAKLINANLRNADLSNALLLHSDLSYANLSYADLSYAKLINANLRNADLIKTNLKDADLRNADLSYANLKDANLRGTDLRNTKFDRTIMRGADVECSRITITGYKSIANPKLCVKNLSKVIVVNDDIS